MGLEGDSFQQGKARQILVVSVVEREHYDAAVFGYQNIHFFF